MGRTPCCDRAAVKRGPWSPEEDDALRSYIQRHGSGGNWIALPKKAGLKRCGKSCRLRWLNYLRPDIRHGGFTDEEDAVILSLYNQLGSKWSLIASQLKGRTDNDVKNYWNTKLKKRLTAAAATPSPSPPPLVQLPAQAPAAAHSPASLFPSLGIPSVKTETYTWRMGIPLIQAGTASIERFPCITFLEMPQWWAGCWRERYLCGPQNVKELHVLDSVEATLCTGSVPFSGSN